MANITTGERIRRSRIRIGWSQTQLAEKLDVRRSTISQWETGKARPNAGEKAAVFTVLGIGSKRRRKRRSHIDDENEEKFWFKHPIVAAASCIRVPERELRRKIESILIRFLKSNAVINKQHVDR